MPIFLGKFKYIKLAVGYRKVYISICPYHIIWYGVVMEEETKLQLLKKWFEQNDVRSFSPQTSMMLLEISFEILDKLNKDGAESPEMAQIVTEYVRALKLTADASHIQQGVVLDKLQNLLGRRGERNKEVD